MKPIVIQCPVKGRWSFLNPPGHHPDAKDFVAVDENGKPYKGMDLLKHIFGRLKASQAFAWEKPVFSPFNGKIIEAENHCEDRMRLSLISDVYAGLFSTKSYGGQDAHSSFGNHVILQSDDGLYVLLAHFRKDSIQVKKGDEIKRGDFIALIGNSGNSIQPHLHFHVMKENSPLTSDPLPFVFSSYEIKTEDLWTKEKNTLPKNNSVFRFL